MSYLLDTNVLSELIKIKPNKNVMQWFESASDSELYISVLSLGEIRKGIEKMKEPKKKEKLRLWLEQDLIQWFGHRILTIDHTIADRWGRLLADENRPLPAVD